MARLIALNSLIDTTSTGVQLIFPIFCALAEHERNLIVQHPQAGLADQKSWSLSPRTGGPSEHAPAVKNLYKSGQ